MSSRPKATLASSLASDLEAALVQDQTRASAAIRFADLLRSPDYAGPFNATVGVSTIVQEAALMSRRL
jgi:hypothetical protein